MRHSSLSLLVGSPDNLISISIRRNKRNNTYFPSPDAIKQFFEDYSEKLIQISFTELSLDEKAPLFPDTAKMKEYFDVFLDVLPRWKRVTFWAPYVSRESLFGRLKLPPAVNLEHVTLQGPSFCDIPAVTEVLLQCWRSTGSIRTFEMVQFNEDTAHSQSILGNPCIYVPLGQLTSLRLDIKMSVEHCCEVLLLSPYLENCSITNVTGPDMFPRPILTPLLERLNLAVNYEDHASSKPTYLCRLFDSLQAPVLHHLNIECDDNWQNQSFLNFLRVSQCTLEALEMFMVRMTDRELYEILQHTPELRILKIHGDTSQNPQPLTCDLMKELTKFPQNQNLLCPSLEMFSVNDDAVEDLPDGILSDMLLSRVNDVYVQNVWFRSSRENPKHQIDIQRLESVKGHLEILQNISIDRSRTAWEDWNKSVRQKLEELDQRVEQSVAL